MYNVYRFIILLSCPVMVSHSNHKNAPFVVDIIPIGFDHVEGIPGVTNQAMNQPTSQTGQQSHVVFCSVLGPTDPISFAETVHPQMSTIITRQFLKIFLQDPESS